MTGPQYEPFGWHHWPQDFWFSYQFRRGLGETQEGGGAVSEVLQAGSRIIPGDVESWHREWTVIARRSHERGDAELVRGHVRTAMNCWLRAANYYREAEFWLDPHDPRRLATFSACETVSRQFFTRLTPPGEIVEIPYENGVSLPGYLIRSPVGGPKQPVLISFGGLDSFKDELWFMTGRGAVQRGLSVLLVDGPGQGGTLRRHGVTTRFDYEVPVGKCIDWLTARADVDAARIAVSGSSLGGYYAARAGAMEPRLAACIAHGAMWDIGARWKTRDDSHGLAKHMCWVFGGANMKEAAEIAAPFKLEGVLEKMRCPFLVIHGGHDVLGVENARTVFDYAQRHGVKATLRLTEAEETGAEHCQHDNPTLGQELMLDWLTDALGIDQRSLAYGP